MTPEELQKSKSAFELFDFESYSLCDFCFQNLMKVVYSSRFVATLS